ncbi:hypothetical protein CLOM_g8789 [Closterium sp. NIES-68]|nr:hypothetical protein CLOM_g8789 [Closterium sp. NIES-68]
MPSLDDEAEASRLVPPPLAEHSPDRSDGGQSAHEQAYETADEPADAMEDGSSLLRSSDGESAGTAGGGGGGGRGGGSSSASSALPASSSRVRRPMQVERHDDLEPRSRLSSLIDVAKRNRLSFAAVAAVAVVLLGWTLSLLAGLLSPSSNSPDLSAVAALAAAVQGKLEDEEKLVTSWQLSWHRAGWAPHVLQKKHAGRHPLFPNLQQRSKAGNWDFMRWLAVAVSGGGLYAHYTVLNLGLPPPPHCFHSALTVYGDVTTPSLVSGKPQEFVALARSSLLPSGADLAAARELPLPRGIVRLDQSTAQQLLVRGRLKKEPWKQATSLLCSSFAQTTAFQAVSLPTLGGMQAALEDLKDWIRLCPTHTTPLLSDHIPSHLLPSSLTSSSSSSSSSSSFSPPARSLTYFLLPHHAALYFAADYEKYHIDPTTGAPQWMRDIYGEGSVPGGLTYSEFLIILNNALMGKNPEEKSDPDLDDRLSRALAAVLHVGMGEVPEEVNRRSIFLADDSSGAADAGGAAAAAGADASGDDPVTGDNPAADSADTNAASAATGATQSPSPLSLPPNLISFGRFDEPHLSIPVLELSLGFRLEERQHDELEQAIGHVWEGVEHFVGAVHGEAKEEMERHSRADQRVLDVVDGRFRQAVRVAQALDVREGGDGADERVLDVVDGRFRQAGGVAQALDV